jgi:ribosome-associated toxin RatA of RatAB toxin-antitoxin module
VKRTTRSAIVAHRAAELYALVEDVEAYPDFLPWCLAAEFHERTPDGASRATLTVGVRGLRQSLTTQNVHRRGESIEMRAVQGPFRHFVASWHFTPLGEHACKIEFRIAYEFASRALAKLLEPLFEEIANTMVDAFKRRADEIHGRSRG